MKKYVAVSGFAIINGGGFRLWGRLRIRSLRIPDDLYPGGREENNRRHQAGCHLLLRQAFGRGSGLLCVCLRRQNLHWGRRVSGGFPAHQSGLLDDLALWELAYMGLDPRTEKLCSLSALSLQRKCHTILRGWDGVWPFSLCTSSDGIGIFHYLDRSWGDLAGICIYPCFFPFSSDSDTGTGWNLVCQYLPSAGETPFYLSAACLWPVSACRLCRGDIRLKHCLQALCICPYHVFGNPIPGHNRIESLELDI